MTAPIQQIAATLFGYSSSKSVVPLKQLEEQQPSVGNRSRCDTTETVASLTSISSSSSTIHTDEPDHSSWGGTEVAVAAPLHQHDNDDDDSHSQRVRFNMSETRYIPNDKTVNDIEASWYNAKALESFESARDKSVKKLLSCRKHAGQKQQQALVQAYRNCSSIKSEAGVALGIHRGREELEAAYDANECLWGLEQELVTMMRGCDVAAQCHLLLLNADHMARCAPAVGPTLTYRRVSTAMTRPSRCFAREVAVAQAAAVVLMDQ